MRPNNNETGVELYECPECGGRIEDPETAVCDECGSELINLSRSRDL
ncbi:rubrerythrin-like domain-containing protein [Halovenus marina]